MKKKPKLRTIKTSPKLGKLSRATIKRVVKQVIEERKKNKN